MSSKPGATALTLIPSGPSSRASERVNPINAAAEFDDVRKKLNAALAGWTPVSDYDADGPASAITGFAKAAQRVVYSLETEPPRGTCENVPLAACKVPRQKWNWNLNVVAFSQ